MRNKIFVCMFFLLCGTIAVCAKEQSLKEPGKNQVLLVGRLSLLRELNNDFYSKTLGVGEKNKNKRHTYGFQIVPGGNLQTVSMGTILGDYFFITVKIPKNGRFPLDGFYVFLFSEGERTPSAHFIYLPFGMEVPVSSENRYVYVGSYTYSFAGDNFVVDGIKQKDEFDEAQAVLNQKLGKNVQLTRAVLLDPEESQKKTK